MPFMSVRPIGKAVTIEYLIIVKGNDFRIFTIRSCKPQLTFRIEMVVRYVEEITFEVYK